MWILILTFLLVAVHGLSHTVQPYNAPRYYTIVLKDDSTLRSTEHATWAHQIHRQLAPEPAQEIDPFTFPGKVDIKSYVGQFYNNTIEVIKKHPDVGALLIFIRPINV